MAPGGLSAHERAIIDDFVATEKATVTAGDLRQQRAMAPAHANKILSRLAKKGWLLRVGRGLYSVVQLGAPSPEAAIADPFALAMSLFAPCFISGWSAAEHWDLTEQIFNSVAVVTARPQRTRERTVAGIPFFCRVLDVKKLFGAAHVWRGSQRVDIADPHRLVIDVLAAPELGGGGRHSLDIVRAYLKSKHQDLDKLIEYAERYGKGAVFKRLGFCIEKFGAPSAAWRQRCLAGMTSGISLLDPSGPNRGKIVTRWGLRLNVPLDDG